MYFVFISGQKTEQHRRGHSRIESCQSLFPNDGIVWSDQIKIQCYRRAPQPEGVDYGSVVYTGGGVNVPGFLMHV